MIHPIRYKVTLSLVFFLIVLQLMVSMVTASEGVDFIPPTYEATVVVPPTGAERRVRGIVVQGVSRQLLTGITVRVMSSEGKGSIDAVTNAEGRFEVTGVPWDRYSFRLVEEHLRVENIHFEPFGKPDTAVLKAMPATSQMVKVSDADGTPVPGAELDITVRREGMTTERMSCCCNEAGEFILYGIQEGTSLDLLVSDREGKATSQMITIDPDMGKVNEATVRLEQGLTITGEVQNIFGSYIPGATLELSLFEPSTNTLRTLRSAISCDGTGRFEINGLPSGRYVLLARARGFEDQTEDITIGAESRTIVLKLNPKPCLMGRVVDESGAPIAEASVFFQAGYTYHIGGCSLDVNDDGSFQSPEFGHEYRICFLAWAEGYVPYLQEEVNPVGDFLNVVLKRGGSMNLHVRSAENGQPLPELRLMRVTDLEMKFQSIKKSGHSPERENASATHIPWDWMTVKPREGAYLLQGLPLGVNVLDVKAAGFGQKTITVKVEDNRPGKDVPIALDALMEVTGLVTLDQGWPPPEGTVVAPWKIVKGDHMITLIPMESDEYLVIGSYGYGKRLAARTDASGRFKLLLPPGRYQFTVPKGESLTNAWDFGPFEVSKENPGEEIRLVIKGMSNRIEVSVIDKEGKPVPKVEVKCCADYRTNLEAVKSMTDAKGVALLDGIPPGKRTLLITAKIGPATEVVTKTFEAPEDEYLRMEVSLTHDEGSKRRITGHVLQDGKAVPDHSVNLYRISRWPGDTQYKSSVKTDETGTYLFEKLSHGSYYLRPSQARSCHVSLEEGMVSLQKDLHLGAYRISGILSIEGADMAEQDLQTSVLLRSQDMGSHDFPSDGSVQATDRFEFSSIYEGLYYLYVYSCPKTRRSRDGPTEYYAGLALDVEAWKGEGNKPLKILLEKAGTIEVSIPHESAVGKVDAFFLKDNGIVYPLEELNADVRRSKGLTLHQFKALYPGNYRLAFIKDEVTVSSRTVLVESGRTIRIDYGIDE